MDPRDPAPSLPSAPPWRQRLLSGSAVIVIAMAITNVAAYGYTIVAARMLGPRPFGAFAAVMGLMLVVGVLQLGVQATGARRVAADPADVAEIESAILQVTYRSALALAAICVALTPVIDATLKLDSWPTALLVGLTVLPMTVFGGQAGILQGERRWHALSWLYLATGVPRLVVGAILLLIKPDQFFAVAAVSLTFVAAAVVGHLALRSMRRAHHEMADHSGTHTVRALFTETVSNSHALLAFFALSNADVIVARTVLDGHESGLYAGGLILVKAVLFLPQFVVIVAFPSMSTASARRMALIRSVTAVVVSGAVATLATWLLSSLALVFIGGDEYAAIQDDLWRFAILGTALSTIQLLVYSVVARQARRSVYLVWAALIAVVLLAHTSHTVVQLVTVVSAVDLTLCLILLGLSLWRLREPAPEVSPGAAPADAEESPAQ